MKAMLTSSLGGAFKVNGRRIPDVLIQRNGLLDKLKSIWPQDARVLIVCANPDNHEKNDGVYACLKKALPMSGLSISSMDQCDDRNPSINCNNIHIILFFNRSNYHYVCLDYSISCSFEQTKINQ